MKPNTTSPTTAPADYRQLMRKVEEVVAVIESGTEARLGDDSGTIHRLAEEIVRRLRDEIGLYRGRLYKRDGDSYVLQSVFPERPIPDCEIRVPRTYAPIERCLLMGTVYMAADDPRLDLEFEAMIGVKEFAAIEVGGEDFVVSFNVAPGHDREDVRSSLAVVRRALNERLRRERVESIFYQAQQIQASILPREAPRHGQFDVAGVNQPVERMGGDLFDFIQLSEKILGVTLADASGHGLPAALQVRDVYVGLRMALSRDFKIVKAIERLNRIIHESTITSRFVTLCYGELESSGNFMYINAGHPPPFHLAADGTVCWLRHGGPVLGPLPEASYERGMVSLAPGDTVVLYSDGISEAFRDGDSTQRYEYGTERLVELVRAHRHESAAEIVQAVFDDVDRWMGGTPPIDDRTVIVIRYPDPGA